MCSLIILRRPDHRRWPLLLAANRDELATRKTSAPDRHWVDRPGVVAGLDLEAGGSWLGVNDNGVVAAVLNRYGTLGADVGKRSRGELVLNALDYSDAVAAATAVAHLDPDVYRPFNMLIADATEAYWVRHAVDDIVRLVPLDSGFSMLTSRELNDVDLPRIRRYLPLFCAADVPAPEHQNWASWQMLLASRMTETGDPRDAMCIHTEGAYGTVSSSLIALSTVSTDQTLWLYASGPPDESTFVPVVF